MSTSTATSTDRITPYWLADRFAEIEQKDMRVTEVRVRSFPTGLIESCVDVIRGKRVIWNARLVEDRTMKAGTVRFVYEKVVEVRPAVRKYSRSRCYACGQPTTR